MNHLARIFRASGRILLGIASIFSIGFIALALTSPLQTSDICSTPIQSTQQGQTTTSVQINSSNNFAFALIAIALTSLILFALYKSLRQYNNSIRTIIRKISKLLKSSIYSTELLLATIIWAIATILAYAISPYIAIIILFSMIINILCFVFAWLAYGQPQYKL